MVFFNHYLYSISSSLICLPRGLVSVYYCKGSQVPSQLVLVSKSVLVLVSKSVLVLVSKSVLVLGKPSDVTI